MNLQHTVLIPEDIDTSWANTKIHKFVERGYALYRALYREDRAIQAPEDFPAPVCTSLHAVEGVYERDFPTYMSIR